jgi:uncharacterized membrane protein
MHVIPQSWPHLHLLIGVFPTFGLLSVLALYIAGLLKNDSGAQRTSLVLFILLALLAVPVYLSGTASLAELSANPRFAKDALNSHYGWGIAAFAALLITGVAAAAALVLSGRKGRSSTDALGVVLGLAVITLGVVIMAGGWNLGHRELEATVVIPDVTTPAAWPQVHIILNHAPTAGFVFALAFFVLGFAINSSLLLQGSLVLFVIASILGVPTYVTGTASMWALTQPPIPEISKAVINAHRDMALWSLFGMAFTGTAAWFELWRYRHFARFSRPALYLVLLFAVVTLGLMTETGHRGGQINHPEIRVASEILPSDPEAGVTPAIEQFIGGGVTWFVSWQIVHFFGYCLILGSALAIFLRIIGAWKSVSFAAVHRLLLLGVVGVLMNVFSGMLMMLRDSYHYVVNDYTFGPKMALLTIGAAAAVYFSVSDRVWKLRPGDNAPASAKVVAVVVLIAWAGVIACGRLLNFL